MRFARFAMPAALAASLFAGPTLAEDAHHPSTSDAPPAQQGQTPTAPGGMMPMMGMMGPGGMIPMMGAGGMMTMMPIMMMMHYQGAMVPMMPMGPGGMMPTMGMMGAPGTMPMMGSMGMGSMGMPGAGMFDRIEGRIAFLRAELQITEPQAAAWDAFAEALRGHAKSLGELRAGLQAGGAPGLVERLDGYERWLAARLEALRALKPAFAQLYAALSDQQKKTAEELVASHMGFDRMGPM